MFKLNVNRILIYHCHDLNSAMNQTLCKSSWKFGRNCRSFANSGILLKKEPDPGIYLKEKEWQLEFHQDRPESRMRVHDIKPVKIRIEKGKKYSWCACGFSHTQPFCDGTHSIPQFKITYRPVVFIAPETKDVWFCNCKKTKNRPFCDGTHRNQEVQDAYSKR
ncbi:CDGSH iron-sulfur domain-containing protein 3, mitochondrial [Armadillidium vulgare]|nr:CDGSH iron-sulfur domain-containing protein 3, mitochondrial [Armadillidium vulgare]